VVWVAKEGKVERRAIKAEAFSGDDLCVIAGLVAGEQLVLDPPPGLGEGFTIRERK
jgi:hypothetical protein